jgi:hypothetical protein
MRAAQCFADLKLHYNFVHACTQAKLFGSSSEVIARCFKVDVKFVLEALESASSSHHSNDFSGPFRDEAASSQRSEVQSASMNPGIEGLGQLPENPRAVAPASTRVSKESSDLVVELFLQRLSQEKIGELSGLAPTVVSQVIERFCQSKVAEYSSTPSHFSSNIPNPAFTGTADVSYANGDFYSGPFVNGMRHGRGFLKTARGEYEGEFVEDKRHGDGKFTKDDGSCFEGRFADDWITGEGKVVYEVGSTYTGSFKYFMQHGTGKYTHPDGLTYEGQYVENFLEGEGIVTYQNGDVYSGTFLRNKMHGQGVLEKADGSKYEGEFFENEYHGSGIYYVKDAFTYAGSFRAGQFEGKGVLTYVNGDIHDGEFLDDLLHGQGMKKYANGVQVRGMWRLGMQSGTSQVTVNDNIIDSPDEETTQDILSSFESSPAS